VEAQFLQHGFGFFAAEMRAEGAFIGFIGIGTLRFEALNDQ
jgi:ribosomal-protein-alanine N-acetyltransferase